MCVCASVGRPKHVRVMAGGLEGDTFIGPTAEVRGLREGKREGGRAGGVVGVCQVE